MNPYVTDTSHWEPWQRDYRLGLIVIMPPPEVANQINPLRAHYDPKAYRICPAHVSVSDPLRRELTPELDAEIAAILRGIAPFTLHFHKPAASHDYAGVAYPMTPQAPVDALKEALHKAAVFAGEAYWRRSIPAHMTIAEFVTIERSFEICAELEGDAPSGSFLCDRLEFIVPDSEMRFHSVKSYRLGDQP